MTDVRIEDIQRQLSAWARQEMGLKDEARLLRARIDELTLLVEHSIKQIQESFELAKSDTVTLPIVIQEAQLAAVAKGTEQVRMIAAQKDQIERLEAKIVGLELEAQESIDRMVEALELPPNKHRTLRNATTETTDMVVEAKKMVRENL